MKEEFDTATSYAPCIFLLRDIDGLLQSTQTDMDKGTYQSTTRETLSNQLLSEFSVTHVFQECTDKIHTDWRKTGLPVMLIATTSNVEGLSPATLSCFKHEIPFEVSL